MPIIIPDPDPPGVTPTDIEFELELQRQATRYFIAWQPYDVVLIPTIKVKSGTGSKRTDGPPRSVQRMRLIPQAETNPPTTMEDGVERIADFVLLGEYDSVMMIGDHWRDSLGFLYEIFDVTATNGYEVKGMVQKRGAQ
jgi:hypothetical protein